MSINFGGIVGGAFNVALGALTGGIGTLINQLATQLISGALNQAVDQSSLPDFAKDLLKSVINQALGQPTSNQGSILDQVKDLLEQFAAGNGGSNGSSAEIGNLQRQLDEVRDMLTQLINDTARENEDGAEGSASAGGRGAPGWLRALAEALGKKLDALADEMQQAAENIDKEDPSTSVDFQVISQQFSIAMNAASTALKSVGEAMTATARKQ